jgi:hypothetical protein
MMGVPTGPIVARPMVARACVCEFQHYAVDKYRDQRLAKFQQTRCPVCVAKLEEERRQAVAARPAKGEAVVDSPQPMPATVAQLWAVAAAGIGAAGR